jgi:hypothetical protein
MIYQVDTRTPRKTWTSDRREDIAISTRHVMQVESLKNMQNNRPSALLSLFRLLHRFKRDWRIQMILWSM